MTLGSTLFRIARLAQSPNPKDDSISAFRSFHLLVEKNDSGLLLRCESFQGSLGVFKFRVES